MTEAKVQDGKKMVRFLTDIQLLELSKAIENETNRVELGIRLKVKKRDIRQTRLDYPNEFAMATYYMLEKWFINKENKANAWDELAEVLRTMEMTSLVHEVLEQGQLSEVTQKNENSDISPPIALPLGAAALTPAVEKSAKQQVEPTKLLQDQTTRKNETGDMPQALAQVTNVCVVAPSMEVAATQQADNPALAPTKLVDDEIRKKTETGDTQPSVAQAAVDPSLEETPSQQADNLKLEPVKRVDDEVTQREKTGTMQQPPAQAAAIEPSREESAAQQSARPKIGPTKLFTDKMRARSKIRDTRQPVDEAGNVSAVVRAFESTTRQQVTRPTFHSKLKPTKWLTDEVTKKQEISDTQSAVAEAAVAPERKVSVAQQSDNTTLGPTNLVDNEVTQLKKVRNMQQPPAQTAAIEPSREESAAQQSARPKIGPTKLLTDRHLVPRDGLRFRVIQWSREGNIWYPEKTELKGSGPAKGKFNIRKFEIGKVKPGFPNKTILLVGASGSGKTTVINFIFNKIYGVNFEDKFRLKLIKEDTGLSQAFSQTKQITVYTIYHAMGMTARETITIIDTPGFGDPAGIMTDQEILEQIKELFNTTGPGGLDSIAAVGFVIQAAYARLTPAQMYIFDSVLSIFGKDIAENIFLMCTFADFKKPKVLSCIEEAKVPYVKYFKFNIVELFWTQEDDEEDDIIMKGFWKMNSSSYEDFLKELRKISPKSLTLTQQVLKERSQLETTVDGLQKNIKIGLNYLIHLEKEETFLKQEEAKKGKLSILRAAHQHFKQNEFEEVEKDTMKQISKVRRHILRLNAIALKKTNPLSTTDYIDMLIQNEKNTAQPGWQERVEQLHVFRAKAKILQEVGSEDYKPFEDSVAKDSGFALDRSSDTEDGERKQKSTTRLGDYIKNLVLK